MYFVIDRNRAQLNGRPTRLHDWHAARAQQRGAGAGAERAICAAHRPMRRGRTSGIVLDMRAQFRDRAEAHGPVRKLGLDGTIGIERIGHAIDNARLEDRD
jgi:hypothetical protein